MERIVLIAKDGYVFTNGTNYGKIIYLANGVSADNYYEITDKAYNKILEEQEEEGGDYGTKNN